MKISTLTIEMAADVARLRQDMDRIQKTVESAVGRIKDAAGIAANALGAVGVGLSVAGFSAFIKGAIDAADALDEMSGRYGVSAKELSALQLSFKQAGMAPDAMAKSLGKLQVEMAKGGEALAAIGVKVKSADGTLRSTTEVLSEVADKFQGMQDGAGKTALAMEIFGKSGADMVPLLNGGSEGIAEMTAMAERLGLVISDEAAAQAGAFNDTLELLGLGVQGVGSQIAAQLLPTLSGLAGQFLQSMTSGDRLKKTADFLAAGLKGLYVVGLGVVELFTTVGATLGGVSAAVVAALSGDFSGAANILRDMKNDIGAGWKTTLADMSAAWNATGNASVEAMAKTMGATKAAAPDLANLGKKAKDVKDEFADLLGKLTAKDAGLDPSFYKDLDTLYQGYLKGRIGTDDYRAAVEKLIGAQQFAKDIAKESAQALADAAAAQNKAYDDFEAAEAKQLKTVEDRIKAARLMHESLQQDIRLQGMSAKERQVATAMLELERQGVVKGTEAYEKYATQIRDAIEIKAANDEHIKMWESIDQTAHDVFVNVFEDGAGTFKRLGQTLKSALLDMLYQMTIKKWIINIQGNVTGSGGAGAQLVSGGGDLSMLGNLASSVSNFFDTGGAVLGSMAASSAAYAAAVPGLTSAAAGSQAAMLAAQTGVFGTSGVAATAAAGGSSALGTLAGAAPYLAAAAAVVMLLSGLDDSGTYHTGGAGSAGLNGVTKGVTAESLGMASTVVADATTQAMEKTAASLAAMFNGLGRGDFNVSTAFADDTSKDGAWGALRIERDGKKLLDWADTQTSRWAPKEFADGEKGMAQYTASLAVSVRDALEQIGLPGWATGMLAALGDAPTFEQISGVMQSITVVDQTMATLGRGMSAFANISDEAVTALAEATGGIANLQASLGYFYQEFFSEGERVRIATAKLTEGLAELGKEMPETRAEFKAMVNAAIAAGDEGLAAKLLGFSGAVASILPAAEDATAAVEAATERNEQALQQRIDHEKALWQQQADAAASLRGEVQGLFDALAGHITDLRAQALGPVLNAQRGQAFIDQALQAALGSGVLPDQAGLETAIAAVRGGLGVGAGQYGNSIDAAYAAAKLAGDLETLQGVAGQQLTQAERQYQAAVTQIEQLDKSLGLAAEQNALAQTGIDATLSVVDAVHELTDVLDPSGAKRGYTRSGSGQSYIMGGAGGIGRLGDGTEAFISADHSGGTYRYGDAAAGGVDYEYLSGLGVYTSTSSQDMHQSLDHFAAAQLQAAFNSPEADQASTLQMLSGSLFYGSAEAALAAVAGLIDPGIINSYQSIPAFANGGTHAGGWAMVGEHGPELAYMPPARIYTAPQTSAMLGGSTQQLEALVTELLARIAEGNAHQKATAETLARVAPGDALVTQAAPAIQF